MKFQTVKNGEIISFIDRCKRSKDTILPLSSLRAQSLANNPRASDDDVILVLAYKDEDLIGFVGFLPDSLRDNEVDKFAWNSGWWVDEQKGKNIAIPLLLYGIQQWNGRVGFIDLPKHTYNILNRLGLIEEFGESVGLKFILRPYLPTRSKFACLNLLMDFLPQLGRICSVNKNSDLKLTQTNDINPEMETFISSVQVSSFQRGKEEFEWIRQWPWITNKNTLAEEQEVYPFSIITSSYHLRSFCIKKASQIIAVVFLKERDGHYSIPYLFLKPEDLEMILEVLVNYVNSEKGKSLYVHQKSMKMILRQKIFRMVPCKNKFQRVAFTKSFVAEFGKEIIWQDGDGDVIFT